MPSFTLDRTTNLIKSIFSMKIEELVQYKKKIKALEKIIENDSSSLNLYRYKKATERFNNLKVVIFDLKMLELRIKQKFFGTINL
jgi:hypothetical protein